MSYDFFLCDPVSGEVLKTQYRHQISGGTYRIGGTDELWLNITFNYAPNFKSAFNSEDGIRVIIGKSGAESIPLIEDAISRLGDDIDHDYWKPTDGNAKKALYELLALAQLRPDGVWTCDY